MKLINSKVEIIPQEEGLLGIYKQIEIAGRTCYKSEDKISEDSATDFVQKMINSGHTAMLEHGTVYLTIPMSDWVSYYNDFQLAFPDGCPWVYINYDNEYVYLTTNYRHLVQYHFNDWVGIWMSEPTDKHMKRLTVRFICDRGVSHELVRHRTFSFAQESSRRWRH